MKRFILLLNHDDISLSAYLQQCLEHGERFVNASGNIFSFRREASHGERIAAVTYFNDDPDMKMKYQIEDYSILMKKRGWKTICVGKPEDIFDSKRHVFLITDQPDAEFPNTSPALAQKANRMELQSLIRCTAMLLLLVGFSIFFLGHDLDVFLSSAHILSAFVGLAVCWLFSALYCLRGARMIRRKTRCDDDFRNFLAIDKATLFCLLSVFALLAAFVLDLIWYPDTGRVVLQGEQRFTIYHDELPLTLEDLTIPVQGTFRSSRLTERKSPIMQSSSASDQSFSDAQGIRDLSLLSYSLYQSGWEQGLKWIAAQKGMKRLQPAVELRDAWHCDTVYSDGHHRLIAFYPEYVLIISVSAELSEIDPDIILSKLLPKE